MLDRLAACWLDAGGVSVRRHSARPPGTLLSPAAGCLAARLPAAGLIATQRSASLPSPPQRAAFGLSAPRLSEPTLLPGWLVDWGYRQAYRCAFPLARLYWQLRRPTHQGTHVAIWVAGRVLCVRQSYRRALSFPGGGIEPDELPREAARRELREELGLDIAATELRHVFTAAGLWDGRRDTVWFHELHLAQPPLLRPDHREVVATAFLDTARLAELRMTGPVRAYLDWRAAQASGAASRQHRQ